LVIAASGSVGQYGKSYLFILFAFANRCWPFLEVVQLLRHFKCSSIIFYASVVHFPRLEALGATHFIDRKEIPLSALASKARSILPDPIEVVYDAFGSAEAQQAGYDALNKGGVIISTGQNQLKNKSEGGGKTFIAVYGNTHIQKNREFARAMYERLPILLEEGTIVVSA
jgi:NADPH:quinone reductase-like Zn-dependent oxidoreductase